MKALIISDDDNTISRLSNLLADNDCDIITYRWLLKALDNVEEINPHLVIISTRDYPRHWKTFIQYTTGVEDNLIKVLLYTDKDFSQDEKKKAQFLGVNGILPSECNDKEIHTIINNVLDSIKNSIKNQNSISFMFTNPISGQFIFGLVNNYKDNVISFSIEETINNLSLSCGMLIPSCSLQLRGKIFSVQAIVQKIPSVDEPYFTFKLRDI